MEERQGEPSCEAGEDLGEPEEPGLVGEQGDDHHRHVEHAADRQALDPAPAQEGREEEGAGEATQEIHVERQTELQDKTGYFRGNLAQFNYLGRTEPCRLRTEKKVELNENSTVTAEKLD